MKQIINGLEKCKRYTILGFTEFGFPYHMHITFLKYEVEPYAQYKKSYVLYFIKRRHKKVSGIRIYGIKKIYIFEDWIDLKTELFVSERLSAAGIQTQETRNCFDEQYMVDAIDSANQVPFSISGSDVNNMSIAE